MCEVRKKKMPQRDLQFPQSPVNLNISTKWSGSQGQRRRFYLHKSWEGSSKEKTPMPISATQSQCVSISLCASSQRHPSDFSSGFSVSGISWFTCFVFMFCCGLSSKVESTFVHNCSYLLIISLCLLNIKTLLSEQSLCRQERVTAFKVWKTGKTCQNCKYLLT